jgi:predicted transglutaminase-like cysteine proteinase
MGKSANKGRYICKVGHYDVYAKDSMKSIKGGGKSEVSSTDYVLYHSRKLIEKGLKTKDLAIEKAKELLGEKYRLIYNL